MTPATVAGRHSTLGGGDDLPMARCSTSSRRPAAAGEEDRRNPAREPWAPGTTHSAAGA